MTWTIANKIITEANNGTQAATSNGDRIVRDARGRLWAISLRSDVGYQFWMVVQFSDDDGASWSGGEKVLDLVDANGTGTSIPGMLIDNDGKPVVSFEKPGSTNKQAFYRREGDDATPAWTYLSGADIDWESANIFAKTAQNFIIDRATGDYHIVFVENVTNSKKIRHKISTDNLASWGSANDVATAVGDIREFSSNDSATLWFDNSGNLYLGSVDQWVSGSAYTLRVFRWNGTSWSRHDSGDTHVAGGSSFSGAWFIVSPGGLNIIAAVGNGNPGETLDVWTSPASGGVWTNRSISPTTRTASPQLSATSDGKVHLIAVANGNTELRYYYTSDQGVTWSAEEAITSGLTGTLTFSMVRAEPSIDKPVTGAAILAYDSDSSSEAWYLASDDLTWPVIAVGLRCTRIVLRAMGVLAAPVRPLDLPTDLPQLLSVNWDDPVEIDTTFSTDVTGSYDSVAEERSCLMDRPFRIMRAGLLGIDQSDSYRILMVMARQAQATTIVPLYSDHSRVKAVSDDDTIFCDTRWRRFFKGGRVVIFDWVRNKPANIEYRLIKNIVPDRLVLTTNLSFTHPVGARCLPMMDVEITLQAAQELISSQLSSLPLQVMEIIGYSALPSLTTGNPPDFQTHDGDPILDITPNWSNPQTVGVDRAGEPVTVGKGRFTEAYGTRPRFFYALAFTSLTRRTAWRLLRFLESRRGRTRPFWAVGAQDLWRVAAITTTYVDIRASGDIDDLELFIKAVAIVRKSGVIDVRAIDSITDNGTTWRLTFDSTIAAVSLSAVRRVTSAHHVRLNSDSHSERWETDEVCSVSVEVIDLLVEQDVEISL